MYAVRYWVSKLSGAYALKYSVVFYDAVRFEELFAGRAPGLVGLAGDGAERRYDAYETFRRLMELVRAMSRGDRGQLGPYKDDLMNLMNLCEEAVAKDSEISACTVPNDTPAPAPLFRL